MISFVKFYKGYFSLCIPENFLNKEYIVMFLGNYWKNKNKTYVYGITVIKLKLCKNTSYEIYELKSDDVVDVSRSLRNFRVDNKDTLITRIYNE